MALRKLALLSVSFGFVGSACFLPKYDIDNKLDAPIGQAGSSSAGADAQGGDSAAKAGAGGASGSAAAGSSGVASGGTGGAVDPHCPDASSGVSPASSDKVTPAIVLFDDIVIQDAAKSRIIAQWQFNDDKTIADTETDPRPGDKWTRTALFGDPNKVSRVPGARCYFLSCDGEPASGSLKNIIPFSAVDQYYEASVLFAPRDFSGNFVSAKVKLVAGGRPDPACRAHALVYGISSATETPSVPMTLTPGVWLELAIFVPLTGFTKLGEVGIRVTTYPCEAQP